MGHFSGFFGVWEAPHGPGNLGFENSRFWRVWENPEKSGFFRVGFGNFFGKFPEFSEIFENSEKFEKF